MKRGDLFFADLSPTVGSEINKRRPVLIVSNNANNRSASTVTVSITSTPLTLGTVTVASNGTFSKSFTVPCTVEAGAHTITATAGSGLRASTPVTLDACAVTLRFTG